MLFLRIKLIFLKSFKVVHCSVVKVSMQLRHAQKHIIKRRRRDLNPRAGLPTYTLSRGASSAT